LRGVTGGSWKHLAPAASGPEGMCRLICILVEALRLIPPLSGGSAPYFTFPGEAGLGDCAHALGAERGEEAAACPLRTFYGVPGWLPAGHVGLAPVTLKLLKSTTTDLPPNVSSPHAPTASVATPSIGFEVNVCQ
jgi:hypothetical protein